MLRRLVPSLIIALLLAGLGVAAPTSMAADPEPDPVATGSAYIGSCMQTARSVSALFVFDRSGSLSGTDPQGVRYEGFETALHQLSRISRTDGEPLTVEVAVAAFDDGYYPARSIVGWTSLNDDPKKVDREISKVVKQTRQHTSPRGGTDFEQPLEGALKEFKDRRGTDNCRLLFWFTDGEFEHNPRGVDKARDSMCAPDGLLDKLRQAGIVIIGLQLGDNPKDLRPMALGKAKNQTCGSVPIPEGWAPGIYLEASDSSGLKRIFSSVSDIVQGCTPAGSSGQIDLGIHRMRVNINTPRLSNTVRFDTPAGENFTAGTDGETTTRSGYQVRSIRDDHYVSMDIVLPTGAKSGVWRVTPDVPVQPDDITFCVFSDLKLKRPTTLPSQNGPVSVVTVPVVDRNDDPANLSDYLTVTPAVVVKAGNELLEAQPAITPNGEIEISITEEPTDARVDIELRVHLVTKSGLALTPLALDFGQALALPSEFPVFEPRDILDLGKAVKTKPTSADIHIIGSPDGPSQVCLEGPNNLEIPDEAVGSTLDFQTGCIDVAVGESKTITVTATPAKPAVGDGRANIPVKLVSADTKDTKSQEVTFDLPVVWRFTNPTAWIVTFVVASIVGLISALVPLLAMTVAAWWAAHYQMRGLRGAEVDVIVTKNSVRRNDDSDSEYLVDILELGPVPGGGSSPRRSFEFGGLKFKSKTSFLPTKAPKFWAQALPGHALLASSGQPDDPEDGSSVTTTPGLGFVAILDCGVADLMSPDSNIPGRLIVLTKHPGTNPSLLQSRILGALDVAAFRRRVTDSSLGTNIPTASSDLPGQLHQQPPKDLWD